MTLKPRVQTLVDNRLAVLAPGWRGDKTTGQRGYTYRWQLARARFLRMYPTCCYCARDGLVVAATVVDHRVPHKGRDTLFWDEENWQSMCAPCHDGQKKREEMGQRERVETGIDGYPKAK